MAPGRHASHLAVALVLVAAAWLAGGCASGGGAWQPAPGAQPGPRPAPEGVTPVAVELAYTFDNVRNADYFPFDGLAGVAWGDDGTLVVCDESRGKVHGLDPRTQTWYEFDAPNVRPYRPVAAKVDGFKVLVLDIGSRSLYRFDLGGVYQDRIVDFNAIDPAYDTVPGSFDVDLDGRVVVTDGGEDQVLVLDSFLALQSRVGQPGPHDEQFAEPSGVTFLPDGGFVVSDRDNRRLQRFNRLGYWEATMGGQFDVDNPFVAPQGLDCDRWGNLFVADPAAGVVHVLDARGRFLLDIGPDLDLQGSLLGPVAATVGPDDQLVVTDRLRSAVIVYRIIYD